MHLQLLPPDTRTVLIFPLPDLPVPVGFPVPPAYDAQSPFLFDDGLDLSPMPYVLGKVVRPTRLIDTVTFDLTGGYYYTGVRAIAVSFVNGETVTWTLEPGEYDSLNHVLNSIKMLNLRARNKPLKDAITP